MTLTKADLADLLFEQVGLNKREAKDMVEAFSKISKRRPQIQRPKSLPRLPHDKPIATGQALKIQLKTSGRPTVMARPAVPIERLSSPQLIRQFVGRIAGSGSHFVIQAVETGGLRFMDCIESLWSQPSGPGTGGHVAMTIWPPPPGKRQFAGTYRGTGSRRPIEEFESWQNLWNR